MTIPSAAVAGRAAAYTPLSDASPADGSSQWSVLHRFGFRFAFLYFLLYSFPGPLGELPFLGVVAVPYAAIWKRVVPWVGAHVLHLAKPISLVPSGSGDKLFDWVQVLVMLAVAFIAAVVWTMRARETRNHRTLLAALSLYLRFYLAGTLFSYGFDKIFPNQFEPMNPLRLTQYFGEAAPGGFAWSFLGSSVMYEVFAGIGEAAAATLLLFRRTALLGAFVGAAVLTNVFMLNMSYDIPVKQYSGHLLLMCCFLVACDAHRMIDFFLRDRPTPACGRVELFKTPRSRRVALAVGSLLAVWMVGSQLYFQNRGLHQYGRLAPRGPLYGIFETESVTRNGVPVPLLLTDASLWKRLASGNRGTSVRLATDSLVRYRMIADSVKHSVSFVSGPDTSKKMVFTYAFPDSMHLELNGLVGEDSVAMRFRRRPESSFLLVNRGFHWINEVPYFR